MICTACSSSEIERPYEAARANRQPVDPARQFGSSRTRTSAPPLAICRACGLAWQDPLPAPAELARIYSQLEDERYVSESEYRRRSARWALGLVQRHARVEDGPLLDVGCSVGVFLSEAARAGWDVWGVEPSTALSRQARHRVGQRVTSAVFEHAELGHARFGVVTMWDVLEHVSDPRSFLDRAWDLLRPGGILVASVPRRDSPVARLLGQRWPLLLPEHVYYFTRRSLRLLLWHAGFRVSGLYPHPVYFSLGYVLGRLSQHHWPLAGSAARWLQGTRAGRLGVPLLMGEVTVVARRTER